MQRIGFVVSSGFQVMSLAALSVFNVRLMSETDGFIRSSINISVATEPFDAIFRYTDCRSSH
jgi:hypothetical protein